MEKTFKAILSVILAAALLMNIAMPASFAYIPGTENPPETEKTETGKSDDSGFAYNPPESIILKYPSKNSEKKTKSGDFEYITAKNVSSGDFEKLDEDNLKEICVTGFSGNNTEIEIPEQIDGFTVTEIDLSSFPKDKVFDKITIPKTINSIYVLRETLYSRDVDGEARIDDFGDLYCKRFECSEDNPEFCSADGVLYTKDKKVLVLYPNSSNRADFTLPDSVAFIYCFAFSHSNNLESVTLNPDVVIGEGAFFDCVNLREVKNNPADSSHYEFGCFCGCDNVSGLLGLRIKAFETYYNFIIKLKPLLDLFYPSKTTSPTDPSSPTDPTSPTDPASSSRTMSLIARVITSVLKMLHAKPGGTASTISTAINKTVDNIITWLFKRR